MRLNRFACLFVFAAVVGNFVLAVPQCNAKPEQKMKATSKSHLDSRAPFRPYTGFQRPTSNAVEPYGGVSSYAYYDGGAHTASPSIAAPVLQGATNGTIGPPSAPSVLPTVGVDPSQITTKKAESPVIPTLLFASLSLSLIFVGVRSLVFKKRAPLFVLGLIAAGTLMLVGFMLSFYEPVRLATAPPMQPVSVTQRERAEIPSAIERRINLVNPETGTAAATVLIPD